MGKEFEIDQMPLDLFIVDDKTGLPLGRPSLTVCIDKRSRRILASQISFGRPFKHSVRRLSKRCAEMNINVAHRRLMLPEIHRGLSRQFGLELSHSAVRP